MKYKLPKGTELADKLYAIKDKMNECISKAESFASSMGWAEWCRPHGSIAGGIGGVFLGEKPEHWKNVGRRQYSNLYFPKSSVKKNRELLDELTALPYVTSAEVSNEIGYGMQVGPGLQISTVPGIHWLDDCILFDVPDWCEWKPEGGEEILASEWKELVNSSKS